MNDAITVLLVDDHALLREGLATVLSRHPGLRVVAEEGTGRGAMLAYRAHRPDVAVVDLRLPDMTGADVIRELRRDYPDGRFVVLTTFDTEEDAYRAFAAGAAAYVLKDASGAEVVEIIRAVHVGQQFVPAAIQALLEHPKMHVTISGREREVLRALADGRSNREIAALLGISAETVKTYLDRMRTKLGADDRAALVARAVRLGLLDL